MYIHERQNIFRDPKRNSNPYRVMLLLLAIAGIFSIVRAYSQGKIWPPFIPTPTPTRTVNSFLKEGNVHFYSGNLEKAIDSYKQAIQLDPNTIETYIQLGRAQIYSMASLTTDAEKLKRSEEALKTIEDGKKVSPDNPDLLALSGLIHSWAKDSMLISQDRKKELIGLGEADALRAIQLDQNNGLAKAYYAELLIDQQNLMDAQNYINQAVTLAPDEMDIYRIKGLLQETMGEYTQAIESYKKASEINPNLSFLYLRIGVLYRHNQNWDMALEYFDKAAKLNEQLGLKDTMPYIAIANTYLRMPESSPMIAARNAYKALAMNPYNQDAYGSIGIIYQRARNYEGAEMLLRCAVDGCNGQQVCDALEIDKEDCDGNVVFEQPLPLTDGTVPYYYTYGSVLSGLHRPGDDKCQRAMVVFRRIREKYADGADELSELVMGIVRVGESICSADDTQVQATPTPQPTQTYPTLPPVIILTPTAENET